MKLSSECKQVIVEAALAGSNNGLCQDVNAIMNGFTLLVDNEPLNLLLQGVLFFGLGETERAGKNFYDCTLPEAEKLRTLLSISSVG